MKKLILLLLILPVLGFGQIQKEVPIVKGVPFGYLEYIPSCETKYVNCDTIVTCPYALLINLHGKGKIGNGTTELYKVAQEGVAQIIRDGKWTRKEFIVISPQIPTGYTMYSPRSLHIFIEQMIAKYKPTQGQVYMVGLSAGANSIYPYISTYRDVRAVVAIAGTGNYKSAWKDVGVRVWSFHMDVDPIVSSGPDKRFVVNYNASADSIGFEHAKLTIYPGTGHTGWQQTYTGEWRDKASADSKTITHRDLPTYDHYNEDIFDWLLK